MLQFVFPCQRLHFFWSLLCDYLPTQTVTSFDLETPLSFSVGLLTGMYPSGFDYMAPPPPYPGPPQNWAAQPQNWTAAAPPPPPGLFLSPSLFIFPLCASVSLHPSDLICLPQSESRRIMPPKKRVLMSHPLHIKITKDKQSPPLPPHSFFWHLADFW